MLQVSDASSLLEHLSWFAALIGLPVALYQLHSLIDEQRRIRVELLRRPILQVSLDKDGEQIKHCQLENDCDNEGRSRPITFRILIFNSGNRTARNVFFIIILPDGVDHSRSRDAKGESPVIIDHEGKRRLPIEHDFIHPGDRVILETNLTFPFIEYAYILPITVSYLDYEDPITHLQVVVKTNPCQRRVFLSK